MKQTIEIDVHEGKKSVVNNNNQIVFEDIKSQLPKTWEEFCHIHDVKGGESYLNSDSGIYTYEDSYKFIRDPKEDSNLLPSKQAAEQHLAHMKLHQLRDCYRYGWKPTVDKVSFGIKRRVNGTLYLDRNMYSSLFLSFQSSEIAEEFLKNFRDLIYQAGDLI